MTIPIEKDDDYTIWQNKQKEAAKVSIGCDGLLDFLKRKKGNLSFMTNGKWLLCTSTHETYGESPKHCLERSYREHQKDGCL